MNYTLPDFTTHLGMNLFFARLLNARPDWARADVRIDSVYGCFPNCIMNGGRAYVGKRATPAQMRDTFARLAAEGVRPRLTFTNIYATEDDLNDPYVRDLLDAACTYGADAIVFSDGVGETLRERYGMKIVLSTTRPLHSAGELNAALARYDWVVLDYSRHKDPAYLGAIEKPGKAELMVNEFCIPNCPDRQDHYAFNSSNQQWERNDPYPCAAPKDRSFAHVPGHPVRFTAEEVREVRERYGIDHFKIVGRNVPFPLVFDELLYYLVRPEYHEEVRGMLAKTAFPLTSQTP